MAMKRSLSRAFSAKDLGVAIKKLKPTPKTAVDKSLARRIKSLENAEEVKYTDFVQNTTTIPNEVAGTPWLLNNINPTILGTAQAGQRIGTQIVNKKVSFRLSFRSNTANIVDNRVRIVMFWYKNANAQLPVANIVFDTTVSTLTYAFINEQYKDSFQIIYDRTLELKPLDWDGTTATIGDQISINKTINLRNKRTRYILGAGAGSYADIVDNSLWIAYMTSANSGAAGINNPVAITSTRVFYVDG